jgi:hypothetical protein
MNSITPIIPIRVTVDIHTIAPIFTYYNDQGESFNGNAKITIRNTSVSYSLVNNDDNLIFAAPIVEAQYPQDLSIIISDDKQTMTIFDQDRNEEDIKFYLVVIQANNTSRNYVSPDPLLKNRL